jgi:hypothetical protein
MAQEELFNRAIGDGTDFPRMTDDPLVNYRVDRKMGIKDPFDRKLYEMEIAAWKESNGEILSAN